MTGKEELEVIAHFLSLGLAMAAGLFGVFVGYKFRRLYERLDNIKGEIRIQID